MDSRPGHHLLSHGERKGEKRCQEREGEKRCQERVKKCVLRSAEWRWWSDKMSPAWGAEFPAENVTFPRRLQTLFLHALRSFISSFSSLKQVPAQLR
jgi:hypothetical protein